MKTRSFFAVVFGWLLSLAVVAQPYGLQDRPPFAAFNGDKLPKQAPTFSGNWSAVIAFPNITFLNPMGLLPMPGTSKLVVWEREGRIYQFENSRTTASKTLMLDISRQTQGWDDSGLMGIAFHPGFATNRYLFVYYTWVAPGTVKGNANGRPPTDTANHDRLERYTLDENGVAIASSVAILIDQISETVWHNGGGMFFHPQNGFLYLTNGDDARGQNNQRINTSLHSGVLRIDVDQRGGAISHPIPKQPLPVGSRTANYYIPNDNPFVGQAGVLEEFFAIGLRSPHRMTIDPPSGRIFIGDVGDGSYEELDVIEPGEQAGQNLQWNRIEGKHGNLAPPYIGIDHPPILDYPHSEGAAIIGGYIYRGQEFAADLGGRYIFGDNIVNSVWMLDETTSPASKIFLCNIPRGSGPNSGNDYVGLSSFGHDQNNELYLCQLSSLGGYIYKLQRGGPAPAQMPALLSAAGVFSDLASLTPSEGIISYDVNSPLWSDAAHKLRWMGVPDGKKIGFATNGDWTFPEGSVFVKHFALSTNDANPAETRRLETRILARDTNGYVYGASYRWRADNSDADIVNGAQTENVAIRVPAPFGALASQDIGGPAAGTTADMGTGYRIVAGGADIWGASDQFRYAYEQRAGDFDVSVRVASVTETDLYTKAGLMVRDTLAPEARHIFALVFPSNAARNNNVGGYEFQSRDTVGGGASAIYPPAPQPLVGYPNTWLRLKRAGNTFTAYSSADGETWRLYATKTLALPASVYVGLALTAHTGSGAKATAEFQFKQTRSQVWLYPSRQDCLRCHTRPTGGVLGLKTRQSNGDHLFETTGVADNQLRAWNHAGYFEPSLEESTISEMLKLVAVTNQTASVEFRVRSYLDANCSHCHRPGGVNANWDARIETPLALANIVGGAVNDTLGIPGARNVAPRDLDRSIMYQRLNTATAAHRMPPLARNTIDEPAVAALAAWIQSLTPPPAVALTAPANGAIVYAPSPVQLTATASSVNGAITRVEFYEGLNKIGQSDAEPFTLSWVPPSGGVFNFAAYATDEGGNVGASAAATVTVIGRGTPGLIGEYFDAMNLTQKKLTRVDSSINFDWGNDSPSPLIGADSFSARWTGLVRPQFTQTYTFWVTADDGVRFWVGNTQLVNAWVDQSPTTYSATIALQAGKAYPIKMEYYENGVGAVARLEWSSPSRPRQVIPSDRLSPPNQAPTIALVSPASGATIVQAPIVNLEVSAIDPDGNPSVEFLIDGALAGTVAAPPFIYQWSNPDLGSHTILARTTDELGATASVTFPLTVISRIVLRSQLLAEGRFVLDFDAATGRSFRVYSSIDLQAWKDEGTITSASGRAEFQTALDGEAKYFRVMEEP